MKFSSAAWSLEPILVSNHFISVLDLYADTPPLETLMEVPLHVRRTQLFKVRAKLGVKAVFFLLNKPGKYLQY